VTLTLTLWCPKTLWQIYLQSFKKFHPAELTWLKLSSGNEIVDGQTGGQSDYHKCHRAPTSSDAGALIHVITYQHCKNTLVWYHIGLPWKFIAEICFRKQKQACRWIHPCCTMSKGLDYNEQNPGKWLTKVSWEKFRKYIFPIKWVNQKTNAVPWVWIFGGNFYFLPLVKVTISHVKRKHVANFVSFSTFSLIATIHL
jgi:hypothetical protein